MIPALPFLEAVSRDEPVPVGEKVVVIGGGNAAIDSARTARRLGADVTIVYRRERRDMPAIPEEIEAAEHEGARIVYLAAPHRIVGDRNGQVRALEAVRTRPGEFDTSGRRRPVPTDEVIRIECDTVILAVGETVDLDFCQGLRPEGQGGRHARGRPLHARDQPRALLRRRRPDHRRLERLERHGLRQEGRPQHRQAAHGPEAFLTLFPEFAYEMEAPETPSELGRHVPGEMPAAERVRSNAEVSLGLTSGGGAGGDVPLPALRHPQRREIGRSP